MKTVPLTAALLMALAPGAQAGTIDSACLKSDRSGGNAALCACIQQVADLMLNRSDQRQAAKFFADPHKAQEARQAAGADNAAFWQRYTEFGTQAEKLCAN
jgi:hypothetical protein